ncbi:hypothetical protein [Nostoc sp. ChiQUE01b]|uniref:hypothetical protein n=1 Tax=Nostoc sp. ChiQUE01b TaxID=3075376 RepID=UPI002AD364E9|nr:hypothetical protein [Nostoc sp. ChiQUE01b]MDZ8260570.1 hypothetical protein [Nostoc sp. ChiQUE01b]
MATAPIITNERVDDIPVLLRVIPMGHSKDHRPDLAQVKIMLSTLDPLGMPIAAEILSGEKADDPLYVPAIQRVFSSNSRKNRRTGSYKL